MTWLFLVCCANGSEGFLSTELLAILPQLALRFVRTEYPSPFKLLFQDEKANLVPPVDAPEILLEVFWWKGVIQKCFV